MTGPQVAEMLADHKTLKVRPSARVSEAAKLMRNHQVSAVLVVDAGRLVGIVTERDIVRRVVAEGLDIDLTRIDVIMTRHPVSIAPTAGVRDALREMKNLGLRHLPVVRGDAAPGEDTLVGVVTVRDLIGEDVVDLALRRASESGAG